MNIRKSLTMDVEAVDHLTMVDSLKISHPENSLNSLALYQPDICSRLSAWCFDPNSKAGFHFLWNPCQQLPLLQSDTFYPMNWNIYIYINTIHRAKSGGDQETAAAAVGLCSPGTCQIYKPVDCVWRWSFGDLKWFTLCGQCEKKDEHIARIQTLDFETKAAIAVHIQEVVLLHASSSVGPASRPPWWLLLLFFSWPTVRRTCWTCTGWSPVRLSRMSWRSWRGAWPLTWDTCWMKGTSTWRYMFSSLTGFSQSLPPSLRLSVCRCDQQCGWCVSAMQWPAAGSEWWMNGWMIDGEIRLMNG